MIPKIGEFWKRRYFDEKYIRIEDRGSRYIDRDCLEEDKILSVNSKGRIVSTPMDVDFEILDSKV